MVIVVIVLSGMEDYGSYTVHGTMPESPRVPLGNSPTPSGDNRFTPLVPDTKSPIAGWDHYPRSGT